MFQWMFGFCEEQFPKQKAMRDTWLVGLISWYSRLGTQRLDITQLRINRIESTFLFSIGVVTRWRSVEEMFIICTINWYVRFERNDPPRMINEDFNDRETPTYRQDKEEPFTKQSIREGEINFSSLSVRLFKHEGFRGSERLESSKGIKRPWIFGKFDTP